ncbi:hypothetical protein [Microbacterium sp. 18062]|uniref:hypothetical protein n=1 Tax=Microbacterium sp. 18062 TaxID=2681410 RepID=UPI00135B37A7|nr:hypothetical protein [Microbacterium sp. 18062]
MDGRRAVARLRLIVDGDDGIGRVFTVLRQRRVRLISARLHGVDRAGSHRLEVRIELTAPGPLTVDTVIEALDRIVSVRRIAARVQRMPLSMRGRVR